MGKKLRKVGYACMIAAVCLAMVPGAPQGAKAAGAGAGQPEYEWRPLIMRTDGDLGADKVDQPAFYSKGRYGGEGYEYTQGASVNKDGTVLVGQDMGDARVSTDFGKTWYTPANLGITGHNGNATAIDPTNSNIMFIAIGSFNLDSAMYSGIGAKDGLYRSTDKGDHWTQVLHIPNMVGGSGYRFDMDTFAAYPVVGGTPDTRVWRYSTSSVDNSVPGAIWSSIGGVAWTKVADLDNSIYGKQYTLIQHPTEVDTLYLATNKGLFRTTDGGVTWTQPWADQLVGQSHSLWIDPDNTAHMLASVTSNDTARRGIWETTDDGSSWSRIMNDINPGQMAVGAEDAAGHRMIYVHTVKGTVARIRNLDGEWITPIIATDYPDDWSQGSITGQLEDVFLPHPTDPDRAIDMGRAYWWRSEGNGGAVWTGSNTNFFGSQIHGMYFDPHDWRKFDIAVQDAGTYQTANGGDSFTKSETTQQQWNRMKSRVGASNVPARSARAIVDLPDPWPTDVPPPVQVDEPGRRILSLGGVFKNFIFTQNKGQTTWNDWIDEDRSVGGDGINRGRVYYSMQNPNIVYVGPNVSTDGGTTWTITNGSYVVDAMSYLDGDTVYATKKLANTSYDLLKSMDRGQTWQTIFHAPYRLRDTSQGSLVFVDPSSDDRLYIVDDDRDVMILGENSDGAWSGTNLNLRAQFPNRGADMPSWDVENVVVDYSDPHLIYALLNIGGASNVWRGKMNADFTAVDWTDISGNAPRVLQSNYLYMDPVTGDLVMGSGNGSFVYPAPDDWQNSDPELRPYKRALWNNLPKAIPTKAMDASLSAADVAATAVTLHWTPVDGASGYTVLRYDRYGAETQAFYAVPAGAASYTFEGLQPNTSYNFRVMADSPSGTGYTHASVMEPAMTRPPAPVGLHAAGSTPTTASIAWEPTPGAVSYVVYKLNGADGQYASVAQSVYASYTDSGLLPATAYTYEVSAVNVGRLESERSAPVTVTTVATKSTAAPGKPTLSDDNGYDTGLQDGAYQVTMHLYYGQNGSTYKLYENGVLIDTQTLTDDTPHAQTASTAIHGKPNGTYRYVAELTNAYGTTKSDTLTVQVTQANPGVPVLSNDNWDGDGNYKVDMNMWWGTNATEYRLYENGALIDTQPLTAHTPAAQAAETAVANRPVGTYEYRADLVNDAGATQSATMTVHVTANK